MATTTWVNEQGDPVLSCRRCGFEVLILVAVPGADTLTCALCGEGGGFPCCGRSSGTSDGSVEVAVLRRGVTVWRGDARPPLRRSMRDWPDPIYAPGNDVDDDVPF